MDARRAALLGLLVVTALMVVVLDFSIVDVALPSIGRS
jgi:hypothetical protein